MSFQNLLFKHYNRSIQLWLMHCLVLRSQSAALSYVLAGWAIIGSTDKNTEGFKPSEARDYEISDRTPHSKETRILRTELGFFNFYSPSGLSRFPWMSRTSVYWAITVRDPRWFSRKNLYPNFWLGTPGTSLYGQTYWGNTVLHRARMLPRCVRWDRTFLRGRAMWHKYIPHCINTCMWRTLRRLV